MITLLFFGRLREALDCAELTLSLPSPNDLLTLKQALFAEQPGWQPLLDDPSTRVAVNQTLITDNIVIHNGDEVAFFPPVTGG